VILAGFYENQKRYGEAISSYNQALTLLPDKMELLYNLAINYYKNGDQENAIKNLLRLVANNPGFTLAYYNLGTLYYQTQEYDKSIQYLGKAVKLNPVLTDAYYNLGLAYLNSGKNNEAVANFEKCKSIDPEDKECSSIISKVKPQKALK
jgi:tetratricopeptide (TPR) repeat protein